MNLNRFVIIHGNMNKLHIKNIYICIKKKKKKKYKKKIKKKKKKKRLLIF